MSGFSTPLYDPGNAAVADIVFIHGLGGDREKTWTKYDVFWPKQLLSKDIPDARVLSWGYNADLYHFWQKDPTSSDFNGITKNFLGDLAGIRAKKADRPLIFAVHSLGGLVCKNALVLAQRSSDERLNNIALNTCGIVFLGTPHDGSDKTRWAETGQKFAKWIGVNINTEVIQWLQEGAARLSELADAFLNFTRNRRESKEQTKMFELIVTTSSAKIEGYQAQSIPADHQEMCKFASKDDLGYQRILNVLEDWVQMLKHGDEPSRRDDSITINVQQNMGGQVLGMVAGTNHYSSNNTFNTG